MKRLICLTTLVLATVASLASASTSFGYDPNAQYSAFAKERFTLGARLEYIWHEGDGAQNLQYRKEFGAGLVGAYSIVPRLSFTGRWIHQFDSKINDYALGLSLKLVGPK